MTEIKSEKLNILKEPGSFVVAVTGGEDSSFLLTECLTGYIEKIIHNPDR